MASLPTSFSVTSTRSSPIPNPDTTVRPPSAKDAEDSAVISTPLAKTSLDEAGIGAPSLVTSQSDTDVDAPEAYTAESVQVLSTPSVRTAEAQPATPTPSARTAESEQVAPVPSLLTPSVTDDVTPPFPLNHARILYNNALTTYDSITSSEGTPLNALIPNTWERWVFDSTASNSAILVELPVAISMDTICIGSHNLGAIGATVSITYSTDGVSFVDWVADFEPDSPAAIMSHVETPRTVKAIQVQILSGATATGFIGYLSAGTALQMQRPFFNGHVPITDADVTEYYSNRTESGNIIGQQIRRQGYETSADWQNIDDVWYRQYFSPFKQAIKTRPFFIAWNLLEYPNDVGFCRVAQDISAPMQNGFGTKRSISMNLLGAG